MQCVYPPSGGTAGNLSLRGLIHSHRNDVRQFPVTTVSESQEFTPASAVALFLRIGQPPVSAVPKTRTAMLI